MTTTYQSDLFIHDVKWEGEYVEYPPDVAPMLAGVRTALDGVANLTCDSLVFSYEEEPSYKIIVRNLKISGSSVLTYGDGSHKTNIENALDGETDFSYNATECRVSATDDGSIT